jgi:hypothetical protein
MEVDVEQKKEAARDDIRAEARHLAEAAVEENDRGNADAAKTLLDRARALDCDAVDEVLSGQKIGGQKMGSQQKSCG